MIPTHRPYLGDDELRAVARVFDSRWLGMGADTQAFELALQDFLQVRHVIAVSTGTAALHMALAALDLPAAAEIIMPSLTFVSAPQVALAVGARPIFCEVDPDTLNIDVDDVQPRMTPRTRVIMPLHYGGYACSLDELMCLAGRSGVRLVVDATHAFGSTYKGRPIAEQAHLSCFSFDPIKNITCGGGGAVATNDDELAYRIRLQHNLGIDHDSWKRRQDKSSSYSVIAPGLRYRMNNLNAAIGLEQLKRFEQFKARRRAIVHQYDRRLADVHGLCLHQHDVETSCPFSYVVRVRNGRRDALSAFLRRREIETLVQFTPNHLHPAFAAHATVLPTTEALYGEILTLPLYYELTHEDVETVVAAVRDSFEGESA